MKRTFTTILSVVLASFMLTGCSLPFLKTEKVQKEQEVKQEAQQVKDEEVFYTLDVERYEAYYEALEEICEHEIWLDGTPVFEFGNDYGHISENYYAIFDIDMDGKEELLVEITTAPTAGWCTKVFGYDVKTDEVFEKNQFYPNFWVYDNGALILNASHNQSQGELWPYTLCIPGKELGDYKEIGYVTSVEKEYCYGEYPEADDADKDGIIYYVTDAKTNEQKPYTTNEYQEWCNKYFGNAKKLYIPWENLYHWQFDALEEVLEVEGVVKPIPLAYEQVIENYDLNGDGKKDIFEIRCTEGVNREYDMLLGYKWDIYLNGEKALTLEPDYEAELEVLLYQISNKRSYLFVKQNIATNNDIVGAALYHAENNKLVQDADYEAYVMRNIQEFHHGIDIAYMTKDFLKVRCHNQFNATASLSWEMNYKYNSEKKCWENASDLYKVIYEEEDIKKNGMTAKVVFDVYESYDNYNKLYTVNLREKVWVDAICFHNGQTYFRAKNSAGQVGWFADPPYDENNWTDGYFEEAMFAG